MMPCFLTLGHNHKLYRIDQPHFLKDICQHLNLENRVMPTFSIWILALYLYGRYLPVFVWYDRYLPTLGTSSHDVKQTMSRDVIFFVIFLAHLSSLLSTSHSHFPLPPPILLPHLRPSVECDRVVRCRVGRGPPFPFRGGRRHAGARGGA